MENNTIELVLIIDKSASMGELEDDIISGFNTMLKQQAVVGKTIVTTVLFNDRYELLHNRVAIQNAVLMTNKDYSPMGQTALHDAIGKTVNKINKAHEKDKENDCADRVIFFIITDGQDCASLYYPIDETRERIEQLKQNYGWEFLFFCANENSIEGAEKFGIATDHAQDFYTDSEGIASMFSSISDVLAAFRTGEPIKLATPQEGNQPNLRDMNRKLVGMLGTLAGVLKETQHSEDNWVSFSYFNELEKHWKED